MRTLFCAAALVASAASAQSPIVLSSTVMVEHGRIVDGQRRTVLDAPTAVVPGETIVVTISYRNAGSGPVANFVVSNPVPTGVVFAGQASPGAETSVDGGKHWGQIAALRVAGPAGERPAQNSDVTGVRWILPVVAPGAGGTLSFKGMVR